MCIRDRAGINSLVNQKAYKSVMYPIEPVIAATWNVDLIQEMGSAYGQEAVAWGVSGIYGPAMNIHRTAFCGRNFEFFSEDGLLSGKIAAAYTLGVREHDVYCYEKHFAIYENTDFGFGSFNWCNEQALREIYLKPFEIAVKEGKATAMMSTYTRLGTTWTGASYPLLTEVLRNEWGFHGVVITDYFNSTFMNANQGIYAGNDLMLSTVPEAGPTDTSNAGVWAMRNACHNIMYNTVNSVAMDINYMGPRATWVIALVALDAVYLALLIAYFVKRKKNRAEKL